MIKPTIGRVVWFHPNETADVLAAIVTYVHDDKTVNLTVFSKHGHPSGVTIVPLYQNEPNEERPASWYCEWMPYQLGQAAKTEQLEKQMQQK